jgi:hypothetical protein
MRLQRLVTTCDEVARSFVLLQDCNFCYFIICFFLSSRFYTKVVEISCDYKLCVF